MKIPPVHTCQENPTFPCAACEQNPDDYKEWLEWMSSKKRDFTLDPVTEFERELVAKELPLIRAEKDQLTPLQLYWLKTLEELERHS